LVHLAAARLGVPIIAFFCEGCNESMTQRPVLDRVVNLFRERTADVWYEKSAAELVGDGVKCAKSAVRRSARRAIF